MQVAISEAKAQLTDLVRRAEAGEDVVLTRHGRETVRLQPVVRPRRLNRAQRRAVIDSVIATARAQPRDDGPCAARSQDFLYDDDGLPA